MSVTSARPRATTRGLRTVVLSFVVLALSAVGLSVGTPATAATSTLSGTGPGHATATLATGLYEVTLSYGANQDGDDPTLFGALLDSDNGTVIELLAVDVKADNSTRKIVQIYTRTKVIFDVERAAAAASWTVTFKSVGTADAETMPSSVTGTGLNSSPFYRLAPGAYRLTSTFANNLHAPGLESFGFGLALYGVAGDDHQLITSDKVGDSASTSFKVSKAGVYWVHPFSAAPDATWSVSLAPLKQFTSTPTPTISGTAKVGRTLTAKPGTWKPSGVKLSYQWYRSGSKISGATKSSYKLTSKDKSKKITVKVTGTKSGYLSVTKTSKSTAAVKK